VARRQEALEAVARRCGEAEVVVADATRRGDVERAMAAALARFGQVDAWVNNVGRGITRPVEQLSDEDVDDMVRDNLKSALYGMQAVLPHLKQRGQGVIVNVSSMLARVPFVSVRAAYSAAKAGLGALTDALRLELARDWPGVRVVLVLPGVVATDFGLNALGGGPDSRALPGAQPVEEVARIIADGMRSGRGDLYTRPGMLERAVEHLTGLAKG
jgi:NAD(P)-dependent dehydrogenase (short-subunit alcohol dehydrogenase family)